MIALILGDLTGLLSGPVSDYPTDRLNHVWAVMMFCIFAIIVGLGQYVGDPIHCWCPAEFTDSHCNYTEAYCWVKDTYYIPQDEPVPWKAEERYEEEVKYYQWVPMILLFLAVCFKIPNIIWGMLSGVTGVNIEKTISIAEESVMALPKDRNTNIISRARYLHRWLILSTKATHSSTLYKCFETLSSFMCFCFRQKTGSYITSLYIFIKLFYLSVAISLLFGLNHMLAMDYLFYGVEVVDTLIKGEELSESPRFPRITMCDFRIRQLQNIQTYSVQCVLSVNLFNEKIFIFIWFLLVALVISNAFALLNAFKNFAIPGSRRKWVNSMWMPRNNDTHNARLRSKFEDHLGNDGVFVLRLIENNTSEIFVSDIFIELQRLFLERIDA